MQVDLAVRYLFLFSLLTLCTYQQIHSETTETKQHKQLDSDEEHTDKRHRIVASNIYSSSIANEFLSYDKCMQRMKCPVSRKEDCSEECQAGNTEEEIEEHEEIINNEDRNSLSKKPKPRYNTDTKKRSNKSKTPSENKQASMNTTDQEKIKTDL
ncbi:unnamed protein product [Rotaria socialis]|uniref:Secreted protein n=1 Tax=Rotaria socialis TaxID=392032 RepID=A0A820H007_9BILA|nr:unnamed protein product [Rotaria socialis]CAF3411548.1 unnamed protein product [Rotaria socialis]CAF3713695.1 unnamed protein product [Rotaria socialis]CAF3756394.1 unnamed protein product [Rotaria socialis]CAF3770905.1 unnamed protein product [Rotaria socialis]